VHLPLVLWDAAGVDAAMGGAIGLDAAMKDAAEALLRSLRRSLSRLLRLLGARLLLLPLLLRLRRLRLFRSLRALFVLLPLCVRRSNGSEKKEQNSRADESHWFHPVVSHYRDFMRTADLTPHGAELAALGMFYRQFDGRSRRYGDFPASALNASIDASGQEPELLECGRCPPMAAYGVPHSAREGTTRAATLTMLRVDIGVVVAHVGDGCTRADGRMGDVSLTVSQSSPPAKIA
jgi:hypothetical protein